LDETSPILITCMTLYIAWAERSSGLWDSAWVEAAARRTTAVAVCNVELLLSSGFSEHDEEIYHQLIVFDAYELGLLATWEMPTELICALRGGLGLSSRMT
jgi:hypothetical protein